MNELNYLFDFNDIRRRTLDAAFNQAFEKYKQEILQWSYHDFFTNSDREMQEQFTINDWKKFLLEPKVSSWIEQELLLLMKGKTAAIISQIGESATTPDIQALRALMDMLEKGKAGTDKNEVFIYTFVPLNSQESEAPNVFKNKDIPKGISDALTIIEVGDYDEE